MQTPAFGVFEWREDNRYHVSDAAATYVRERAAQACADKMNAGRNVWVVRTLAYCRADQKGA